MRKLSSQQQFAAVTISLSLAVAAFPTFSTNASRVMPQDLKPSVSDSLHQEDRYRLAQTSDNCRRVSASGGLQVRQQPSIASTVVGVVEDGRQVAIKNPGASGWVQIYAPLNGYISAAYLKYCTTTSTPTPSPTPTPTPLPTPTSTPSPTSTPAPTSTSTSSSLCRRVVANGGLQVRQQPSIGSTVVGFVANGQNVTIEDRGASGWVSISAPLQGYASAAYLRYCPSKGL